MVNRTAKQKQKITKKVLATADQTSNDFNGFARLKNIYANVKDNGSRQNSLKKNLL